MEKGRRALTIRIQCTKRRTCLQNVITTWGGIATSAPRLCLILINARRCKGVSSPSTRSIRRQRRPTRHSVLFQGQGRAFPFITRFRTLRNFRSTVRSHAPSRHRVPSRRTIPRHPVRHIHVNITAVVSVLPTRNRPYQKSKCSYVLIPSGPYPFKVCHHVRGICVKDISYDNNLIHIMARRLPTTSVRTITPSFRITNGPSAMLSNDCRAFQVNGILQVNFRSANISGTNFRAMVNARLTNRIATQFLRMVRRRTATSKATFSHGNSNGNKYGAMDNVLRSRTNLITFLSTMEVLIILFLLNVRGIVMRLYVSKVTRTLLIRNFCVKVRLCTRLM